MWLLVKLFTLGLLVAVAWDTLTCPRDDGVPAEPASGCLVSGGVLVDLGATVTPTVVRVFYKAGA
jgi:hypothetical protein